MARNLQDAFFQKAKNDGIPVSVYLLSGFRISGLIKGFDTFTVLIEQQETGGTQLIFKHAISTVSGGKNLTTDGVFSCFDRPKQKVEPKEAKEEAKEEVKE